MRYVMTFFWSFCLVAMLNYVAGAIANVPFDFMPGVIVSVIVAVISHHYWVNLFQKAKLQIINQSKNHLPVGDGFIDTMKKPLGFKFLRLLLFNF